MNKLTKAAIAVAAGVILLMGGAGSLAYWSDSALSGPTGQTISAGNLAITAVNAGSWTKAFSGTTTFTAGNPVADITAVRIVPGNRLVYTQTFNVSATGDDLFFTVGNTANSVSGVGGANAALAGLLTTNSSFTVTGPAGGNVVASGSPNTYKVNTSAGPSVFTVTWTLTLPFNAGVVDNSTKTGVVSLLQGAVTLTQLAAS